MGGMTDFGRMILEKGKGCMCGRMVIVLKVPGCLIRYKGEVCLCSKMAIDMKVSGKMIS